jgi:hypothetical protein
MMIFLPKLTIVTVLATALVACAQTPVEPAGGAIKPPTATGAGDRMAMMDAHMKAMREMHDKMARARTPEERNALMTEHMKLMQEGMAMMNGMGSGGMGGMMGMDGMQGGAATPADMATRQQMMEMRMEMMQSMMQMMMDRLPPAPAKQ